MFHHAFLSQGVSLDGLIFLTIPQTPCLFSCIAYHVCYLRKCLSDEPSILPLGELRIVENKRLFEEPVEILEWETKQLRKKRVKLVKVLWKNRHGSEMTWEAEDEMRSRYPKLFEK